MSTPARILVIGIAAVLVGVVIRMVGRRGLRSKYALLWLIIVAISVPIAIVPSIADAVAERLGIASTSSMLLMMASAVLLLIVIQYSWELSRLEGRARRLAEAVALLAQRLDELERTDRERGKRRIDE